MVPNKETSMTWAEHQNIVAQSRSVFAGARTADAVFDNLQVGLGTKTDASKEVKIFVSKGIHQPETNPHMQIETETVTVTTTVVRGRSVKNSSGVYIQRFHLNLSAVDQPDIMGLTDRFIWRGVQYTQGADGTNTWPVAAPIIKKTRRNSVGGADYAAQVATNLLNAEFDALCRAFETLHNLEPIDRSIRTKVGWAPHVAKVKAPSGAAFKFKYNGVSKVLTKV
jgi:hypothetical protein